MKLTDERKAMEWAVGTDTGVSSLTIWSVMTGIRSAMLAVFGNAPPSDPSDFGRCVRLLRLFPAWRGRLAEVAAAYPNWTPYVERWAEMEALYERELARPDGMAPELFALMLSLRLEAQ